MDASGNVYTFMNSPSKLVFGAALEHISARTEELFKTYNDDNRATVTAVKAENLDLVGACLSQPCSRTHLRAAASSFRLMSPLIVFITLFFS